MNVPVWVVESAADFWRDVPEPHPFPRDLRSAIPRALPLSVFVIADLSLGRIQECMRRNGIVCDLGTRDRRLRAGVIARNGHGIACLDGKDADDEQRFSLAHELAHFLRDYWRPRCQVKARLGAAALEATDGLRLPSLAERVQSLIRFAPMGFHVHLLDRDPDGLPATAAIAAAEEDADRLAYELLAPAEHLGANILNWRNRAALQDALVSAYGLPPAQAAQYGGLLLPPARRADPLLQLLKF